LTSIEKGKCTSGKAHLESRADVKWGGKKFEIPCAIIRGRDSNVSLVQRKKT